MITRRVMCTNKTRLGTSQKLPKYTQVRIWGMGRVKLGETYVNTFSALLMLIFDKCTSFIIVLYISIILSHNFCIYAVHTPVHTHARHPACRHTVLSREEVCSLYATSLVHVAQGGLISSYLYELLCMCYMCNSKSKHRGRKRVFASLETRE